MDPKTMTKLMVLKRLVESIDEKKVEKNLPAMEKVADKITDDIGSFILPLLAKMMDGEGSLAPKQSHIKGLSER